MTENNPFDDFIDGDSFDMSELSGIEAEKASRQEEASLREEENADPTPPEFMAVYDEQPDTDVAEATKLPADWEAEHEEISHELLLPYVEEATDKTFDPAAGAGNELTPFQYELAHVLTQTIVAHNHREKDGDFILLVLEVLTAGYKQENLISPRFEKAQNDFINTQREYISHLKALLRDCRLFLASNQSSWPAEALATMFTRLDMFLDE